MGWASPRQVGDKPAVIAFAAALPVGKVARALEGVVVVGCVGAHWVSIATGRVAHHLKMWASADGSLVPTAR